MRSAQKTDSRFVKVLANFTLILAITVIVGQFKRAPLCYIVLWYVLQKNAFAELKVLGKIFLVSAILIIIMIGITGTYQQGDEFSLMKAVLSLFWRLFVGEAIGEFLALEHHGANLRLSRVRDLRNLFPEGHGRRHHDL